MSTHLGLFSLYFWGKLWTLLCPLFLILWSFFISWSALSLLGERALGSFHLLFHVNIFMSTRQGLLSLCFGGKLWGTLSLSSVLGGFSSHGNMLGVFSV